MNEQNLKPVRTKSEARERGRKGGKKSGEARRERKAVRKVLEAVLSAPITNTTVLKDIERRGLPVDKDGNYLDYIVASIMLQMAKRGTMADLEKLIAILGEEGNPEDQTLDKIRELLDTVPSVIE